jgi:hypothetical protein
MPPDIVEQRIARLYVGDDGAAGMFSQDVAGEQRHQLIAVHDPAKAVDDADAVAVAVEPDAEIAAMEANGILQLDQVGGDRRVGTVGRKVAVDDRVQEDVLAGEALHERRQDIPSGAVSSVPRHGQGPGAVVVAKQSLHIRREHDRLGVASAGQGGRWQGRELADAPDPVAKHRPAVKNELEAVVVGRVMRTRDHDAAVGG